MSKERNLLSQGIAQLEALFAEKGSDLTTLERLAHELQFRQVPRAVALADNVKAALEKVRKAGPGKPVEKVTTTHSEQGALFESPPATPATVATLSKPEVSGTPEGVSKPQPVPNSGGLARIQPEAPPASCPTVTMSVAEAYRTLKAMPGASWESLEQSRRELVQAASPINTGSLSSEKRESILAEARRVNAACAILFYARGK